MPTTTKGSEISLAHEEVSLLGRLAESLGGHASAQAVYGAPVEHGGIMVIPVARVRYAFGGGGGGGGRKSATAGEERGAGSGGGGAIQAQPVGFVVMREGHAEFREIPDPVAEGNRVLALVAGVGLSLWLILRGLRALSRH